MRVADLFSLGIKWGLYALILIAFACLVFFIGYKLIYKKACKGTKTFTIPQIALYAMFTGYIFVVFGVTLLNRYPYETEFFRLTPFYSYLEAWHQYKDADWRNLILNIFMLVPFGLLLPYLHQTFRRFLPTALAGFLFTVCIEAAQLVLKRGIFETDDLINNTLGTVIGYGFFRLADYIHKRMQKEKVSPKPVLLYQLPLLISILAFISIFSIHDVKELGNLRCHHIIKAHPMSVTCNTEFDTQSDLAYVYVVPVTTVEETETYAKAFLSQLGYDLDDSRTDIYDESAFYYSKPNDIILCIDYEGNKIEYTNFAFWDDNEQEEVSFCTDANETDVRNALEKLGFYIPAGAEFEHEGEGKYRFKADCIAEDGSIYDGTVTVRYNTNGDITDLGYKLIKGTPYREFPIISEEEAYRRIAQGFFRFEPAYEPENIIVSDIFLAYEVDSKGFYQPIYILECHIDGKDTRLYTPAIR